MPEEEIEPYLISVPLHLGPYNALFSKLGASTSVTISYNKAFKGGRVGV